MNLDILISKLEGNPDANQSTILKWVKCMPNSYIKRALLEKLYIGIDDSPKLLESIKNIDMSDIKIMSEVANKPLKYKKGDILMHPIFKHPYILLDNQNGSWVCGLLTSDVECSEILEKTRSRFFNDSYFTKVLFIKDSINGIYMGVYDNNIHLKKIYAKLKNLFL